jgi:para-aminobenzoate synthetase component 1
LKKYFTIKTNIDWEDIISYFRPSVYNLLDTNNTNYIIAWDIDKVLEQKNYRNNKLQQFQQSNQGSYIFGFLSYNTINKKTTLNKKELHNFPDSIFYVPKHILINKNGHILYFGNKLDFLAISNVIKIKKVKPDNVDQIELISSIDFKSYLEKFNLIKKRIQNGDVYEVNFCLNFSKNGSILNTEQTYQELKSKTKAPFGSLFKYNNFQILSASPERFYLKKDSTIICQPIKGTSPRGYSTQEDNLMKKELINNSKEISENIMIVDLVRNDLSKIAVINSLKVSELCEIYSFKTVHQLISTIQASIFSNLTFESICQSIFPIGSMTGAPKMSSLNIISEHEDFNRSVYSGSIGFISPTNNHDFNVVIRSILYNSKNKTISISVGGAITINSEPLSEYNECLLKLDSIKNSIVLKI